MVVPLESDQKKPMTTQVKNKNNFSYLFYIFISNSTHITLNHKHRRENEPKKMPMRRCHGYQAPFSPFVCVAKQPTRVWCCRRCQATTMARMCSNYIEFDIYLQFVLRLLMYTSEIIVFFLVFFLIGLCLLPIRIVSARLVMLMCGDVQRKDVPLWYDFYLFFKTILFFNFKFVFFVIYFIFI